MNFFDDFKINLVTRKATIKIFIHIMEPILFISHRQMRKLYNEDYGMYLNKNDICKNKPNRKK